VKSEHATLNLCVSGAPGLAQASIKGRWEFGRKRGALLVMAKPSSSRMPPQVLLKHLIKYPELKDKKLVTQVYHCHAYTLYLSGQGEYSYSIDSQVSNPSSNPVDNDSISLALVASVPVAPGLSVSGNVGMNWWKHHSGGLFRDACDEEGKNRYTPLYILKEIRKPGLLRRDNTIIPPQGDNL
jgi:hypothetical protein